MSKEKHEPWFLDSVIEELNSVEIIPVSEFFLPKSMRTEITGEKKLLYDPRKAFAYAKEYCRLDNSCGERYEYDCAHFMAHCLAAGGVVIKGSIGATCPHGLVKRAVELANAFEKMVEQYSNVSKITFDDVTKKGDYGFFKRLFGNNHAFLLNGRVASSGKSAPIFGHTNNRCGESVSSEEFLTGVYYRIE